RVHLSVYLPAGYAGGSERYPVVYFLHGLPAGSHAYCGVDYLRRALDAVDRPAILVAPQGARDGDSDPEYLDWGPGRNWETAHGVRGSADVLRFLRRRARRPLPRREPRARPRAARGTGPARLPRLPGWARRDGLERARDGVAPVSAGTPRAGALTEEIPRAKG